MKIEAIPKNWRDFKMKCIDYRDASLSSMNQQEL